MDNITPKAENTAQNSLVESIVRQAEENSRQQNSAEQQPESRETPNVGYSAKRLLSASIAVGASAWLISFAALSDSSFLYEKLGYSNLTHTLDTKTAYLTQVKTDLKDVNQFQALLRSEGLSVWLGSIDLDDSLLTYKLPVGEWLDTNGGKIFRFTNSDGQLAEMSEADIAAKTSSQKDRADKLRTAVQKLAEFAAADLNIKLDSQYENIAKNMRAISDNLSGIDFREADFPSANTTANIKNAQAIAKTILVDIKDINLKNLVSDLKKQADAISDEDMDKDGIAALGELKALIATLNTKSPKSFESAIKQAKLMELSALKSVAHEQAIQIIGDEKTAGDLADVAITAANIGRVNLINTLAQKRIEWQDVLKNIHKIARLGADLLPDESIELAINNSFTDIDPSGSLITFNGFSANADKSSIEVRGIARDAEAFSGKNFTLISKLIDSLEGSTYFQNVSGLNFNKSKLRDGAEAIPFNLNLQLQAPGQVSELDAKSVSKKEVATNESVKANIQLTNNNIPKDSVAVAAE